MGDEALNCEVFNGGNGSYVIVYLRSHQLLLIAWGVVTYVHCILTVWDVERYAYTKGYLSIAQKYCCQRFLLVLAIHVGENESAAI